VLTRSSETKIEAAAAATHIPDASVATSTSDVSDLEEFAWNRAQTKISIFSAQQYVENYLAPPFKAAGYVNLNFIDVSTGAGQVSGQKLHASTAVAGASCSCVCFWTASTAVGI
jgi:hypothetical protein